MRETTVITDNIYASLSLTARLAIGLHCFSRYCESAGILHPEIDALLDDLWEFPVVWGSDAWWEWESHRSDLIHTGLGDEFPMEFEDLLRTRCVRVDQFRELLESLVEIVYGSLYGASDDAESLRYLENVIRIVRIQEVSPPGIDSFAASRFKDRHGWGNRLSAAERDAWRSSAR